MIFPFQASYPESVDINNLSDGEVADFIATKTGDLNLSANMGWTSSAGNRNFVGQLDLQIEDQYLEAGKTYRINFQAKDFKELVGYQLALLFNHESLSLENINTGDLIGLNASNFGTQLSEQGIITMNWSNVSPISLKDQSILFSIDFEAKANAQLSDLLQIDPNRFIEAEAYKSNLDHMNIGINYTNGTALAISAYEFKLFQNFPNPFRDATEIAFIRPQDSEGKITVYDISGKILKVIDGNFKQGFNSVSIRRADLDASGVLYYKLETVHYTADRKMIVLE